MSDVVAYDPLKQSPPSRTSTDPLPESLARNSAMFHHVRAAVRRVAIGAGLVIAFGMVEWLMGLHSATPLLVTVPIAATLGGLAGLIAPGHATTVTRTIARDLAVKRSFVATLVGVPATELDRIDRGEMDAALEARVTGVVAAGRRVSRTFGGSGKNPGMIRRFMNAPNPALDGSTPVAALRAGDAAGVIRSLPF